MKQGEVWTRTGGGSPVSTTRSQIVVTCIIALLATDGAVRGESKYIFGIHHWGRGANVDVMSHETGWLLEFNLSGSNPNIIGRIQPGVGEGFTLIQRLDWNEEYTVPVTEADRLTFANDCARWAGHLKKFCRYYLIGNEMELWGGVSAHDYALVFRMARDAIQAVQPEARVIIGHWCNGNSLRSTIQQLGPDGYDGVCDHTGSTVSTSHLDMLDEEGARPGVGVYVTEFGWVRDTNPNAFSVLRNYYQEIGQSNASRERQIYCACWFVYPDNIGWDTFALELALIDNPAFEAATALHTSFNSYAANPVIMTEMIAEVPDVGDRIAVSWETNVGARQQLWWVEAGQMRGDSTPLQDSSSKYHSITLINLTPSTAYEVMPLSTANDYGDAGGRRFRVKTGPWETDALQAGPGRVVVYWDTDWPARTMLEYGPDSSLPHTVVKPGLHTAHYVDLTGLPKGIYNYRVSAAEPNPDGGESLVMRSPIRSFQVVILQPGDMDDDGDVDLEDFGLFQACYSGAGVPQTDDHCVEARIDADEDVDHDDFGLFQACMTGANIPADPDCAMP